MNDKVFLDQFFQFFLPKWFIWIITFFSNLLYLQYFVQILEHHLVIDDIRNELPKVESVCIQKLLCFVSFESVKSFSLFLQSKEPKAFSSLASVQLNSLKDPNI